MGWSYPTTKPTSPHPVCDTAEERASCKVSACETGLGVTMWTPRSSGRRRDTHSRNIGQNLDQMVSHSASNPPDALRFASSAAARPSCPYPLPCCPLSERHRNFSFEWRAQYQNVFSPDLAILKKRPTGSASRRSGRHGDAGRFDGLSLRARLPAKRRISSGFSVRPRRGNVLLSVASLVWALKGRSTE